MYDDTLDLYDLAKKVIEALGRHQKVLGTAESCTGGMLAMLITACPGASEVFRQGIVSYHNEAKERLLQVPSETLERFGAVSQETAIAMALGVLKADIRSDIAISTTGIAGPGGATKDKPVGLVCFALASKTHCVSYEAHFVGDRQSVREQACAFILQKLLVYLQTLV